MQSETIGKLAEALAKAQAKTKNATKDKDNPFFKSKYADLASVWEACRGPLTDNGLSVVQTTRADENAVIVVTTLMHSSGEWISGELGAVPVKRDPQGIGSVITYLRRYGLAAIAGVATEDDDGNGGSTPGPQTQQQARPAQGGRPPVTDPPGTPANGDGYKGVTNEQLKRLFAIGGGRAAELRITSRNAGESIVRAVYATMGYQRSSDMPADKYDAVCAAVQAWEPKKEVAK